MASSIDAKGSAPEFSRVAPGLAHSRFNSAVPVGMHCTDLQHVTAREVRPAPKRGPALKQKSVAHQI